MRTRLIAAAALFVAPPAMAQPATNVVPIPCQRVCMEDLAGQVLAALASHDAASLPLAKNARYTENGQEMGFDNKPSSILLAEAFKIDGSLIRQVEAVGVGVPYHMRPGWGRQVTWPH